MAKTNNLRLQNFIDKKSKIMIEDLIDNDALAQDLLGSYNGISMSYGDALEKNNLLHKENVHALAMCFNFALYAGTLKEEVIGNSEDIKKKAAQLKGNVKFDEFLNQK